ncbi:hypothetical protein A2714_05530 [Candidatus Woesebacteria bacterium RIFCSPHIGHO2_01_FULL_38_9]|uniref:Glycosyltransferase RgtA/B/C/D-like domain-containing protein n=2 Tax=Candidatus Woeseibacteriota TaxID=1752722 RepID=A0A1F7Y393_9BACT|nr:MAG: hypothetical protein A2714_05530 [Candidatus Woesebacteria bacterium RIFCSPHIGHO2_01_FULL_38_9]OGM60112.1 MAG: hypothetical protein A3A75_01780 [Candidatus Woesebacteria bacterium RIFCSPLOWO2_01_FULL_39_10]
MKKYTKFTLVVVLAIASFLRLWKISEVPVSLFGDELDVGYHAYSILKTGRDYSGNFMPLHFQSLAEWRTPLYLYSSVPTVALFGISPLGVRLPAASFGILGVLGIYLLIKELLSIATKRGDISIEGVAILSAAILALSPWHIQYSRAAFEVTELFAFLIFGLYFFFRSLRESKFLWVSVLLLTLTPWIYSTAKLFTPVLLLFLFIVWRKEILCMTRMILVKGAIAGIIVGLPIAYSILFGGGTQRAAYTSVFTDPTIEPEVGTARFRDAVMANNLDLGYIPAPRQRLFHNKVTFWAENISKNYLQSFSFDFLFEEGDSNLRHSIKGTGQFYKIEVIALVLGVVFFFTSKIDRRIKAFLIFWIIVGALPAELTRDGGNHATRLFIILPPLLFLISYGLIDLFSRLKGKIRFLLTSCYLLLIALSFIFYQHTYWVHNPWDSERWWHAGFKEAILAVKEIDEQYNKVIISMAGEPAWIFFAGLYQYPPDKWQREFPIGNDVYVEGFGKVSHTDKFYFGTFNVEGKGLYDLDTYIDNKTLYLALASEIGANLIMEPERTPANLKLLKAIPYPSGEPAFYLFTQKTN